MVSLSVFVSFLAGIVSFISPCVLPIIPGFLAYLAGVSVADREVSKRLSVFLNSFFFVLGFSFVFSLLGVLLNGILANIAYALQIWLSRIGGVIVIFFGLYLMGFFKLNFLEYEHKLNLKFHFHSRYLTSLLFGFAFAVGWTPCVGPILGSIIGLAASAPESAFSLFLAYSLGLGLPFLLVGLFVGQSSRFFARYAGSLKYVNFIFGIILVGLGVLVFTQELPLIANFSFFNNFLLK